MSPISVLWPLAGILGASLILQGIVLRSAYRRNVAKLHAKHLQFKQTVNGQFEQTRRQIGQLQNDLAARSADSLTPNRRHRSLNTEAC